MFKRRSFIALLALGVLILYGAMDYYQQYASLRDVYKGHILNKEKALKGYLTLARALGKQDLWDDAHDELTSAVDADIVDFYLLTYRGSPVWYGSYKNQFSPVGFKPTVFNQFMISDAASFETLDFGNGYQLTMGLKKDLHEWISKSMGLYATAMEQEALFYVLIVVGVALYLFRDFFKIIRSVRDGRLSEISKIKTTTAESELFLRGFTGFAQNQQRLQSENSALSHQVLPSLQKEIFSGRKPPYDFKCTLVRTDINNFSHIYNTHDVGQFMGLINEFFIEVSHVVARYQGLVHEFVGDEIIYFFKDDDHANSFLIATSAIRDVNAVAERFHQRALKDYGYAFTIKSSLAHGILRFGPLVNGFSLAGSVLIETVRILAHVTEKSGNVIYFDDRHVASLVPLVHSHQAVQTQLKGFSGQRSLHTYDRHESLASVLGALTMDSVAWLAFYRSDQALCEMLVHFKTNFASLPANLVLRACHEMRRVRRTATSEALVMSELWSWIDELQQACESYHKTQPWKILSAAIMLAANFISRDEFDIEKQHRLEALTHSKDKRVAANALEVLMHLRSSDDVKSVALFIDDENIRLSANAIIFQARTRLDETLTSHLRERLKSKTPTVIASGLYAIGEIAAFYRKQNAVALQMQVKFIDLYALVAQLSCHNDESVRKQAARTVAKISDLNLTESVLKFCRDSQHGEIVLADLEELGVLPRSSQRAA